MKFLNILFITALLLLSAGVAAQEKLNTADVFSQMKSLVGVWHKKNAANSNFSISFELTANDTVLIETWLNKGKKHSLTLYHLNNGELMATHYCPQGNQPRMQLTDSSTNSDLSFAFLDATNLKSVDNSHQHSLGFQFLNDNNSILRKEVYLSKSGKELSELMLVRKQ